MKIFFLIISILSLLGNAAGEKYLEIKKDLLISDPLYMENHKEEALVEKIDSTELVNKSIPRRIEDKYVSIFILPYVDSRDVYHDESRVMYKYKAGKWLFGEFTDATEQTDVVSENKDEFTFFNSENK